MYAAHTWALVLAAGEGSRLRTLTTSASGMIVPKQFCSLYEGPSLLQEALGRAQAVATIAHTCAVVAAQHRRWWTASLRSLPVANVIVQPQNRGTANGILLPLLHIIERDPTAQIVLLPSDHHVRQEAILSAALGKALEQLRRGADETILLGLQPEEVDPDLGYVVPGGSDGTGALPVERFVEKPALAEAAELIRRGALWNAFIVASSAQSLLAMFRRRMPEVVREMHAAVQYDLRAGAQSRATSQLYDRLTTVDFSSGVLQGQEARLRVLPVPPCGWSDLGTPKRVADALRQSATPAVAEWMHGAWGFLSLAAQHEHLRPPPVAEHRV